MGKACDYGLVRWYRGGWDCKLLAAGTVTIQIFTGERVAIVLNTSFACVVQSERRHMRACRMHGMAPAAGKLVYKCQQS